jgi:hypothetical protein
MEPSELLRRFIEILDRLGIPYLITGSMATIAYGEPRFTNDIDVVMPLRLDQVDRFCEAFPPRARRHKRRIELSGPPGGGPAARE